MKAVVYVLGDRKHKTNFWDASQGEPEAALLSGDQIKEMAGSGLDGNRGPFLEPPEIDRTSHRGNEKGSRGIQKEPGGTIGETVYSFAYPYGDLNGEVKEAVREAGYPFGIAVEMGPPVSART